MCNLHTVVACRLGVADSYSSLRLYDDNRQGNGWGQGSVAKIGERAQNNIINITR